LHVFIPPNIDKNDFQITSPFKIKFWGCGRETERLSPDFKFQFHFWRWGKKIKATNSRLISIVDWHNKKMTDVVYSSIFFQVKLSLTLNFVFFVKISRKRSSWADLIIISFNSPHTQW
jgi:hypothetical protein